MDAGPWLSENLNDTDNRIILKLRKHEKSINNHNIHLALYLYSSNQCTENDLGTVIDEKGESMIGVHVAVKGTNIGTITNIDGKFTIHSQEKSPVLIFSYVGYKKAEVRADKNILNVQMEPMENVLEDVVIVGYGSQKKGSVTGSVAQVNARKLCRHR